MPDAADQRATHPEGHVAAAGPPPMVHPRPASSGTTTIRHGRRFVLGLEASGSGGGYYFVAPRGLGGSRKASWFPLSERGWLAAWQEFASREPDNAAECLRALEPPPVEETAPAVPLLTLPSVPGRDIEQVLGLVTACSVVSRLVVSDPGPDVVRASGGSLEGIEKAISLATDRARSLLYVQVQHVGAEAVVGLSVRLDTVADQAQAVFMAGTAVRLQPPPEP